MKKLIVKILSKFLELRTRYRANLSHFRRAVRRAERLAAGNGAMKGKRTYVYFLGGKYRTFNRKDIQRLKKAGIIKQHITLEKLSRICLYDTQTKVNSHPQFKYAKLRVT